MITQSTEIGFLAASLSKLQGELKNSAKTSVNPHFKSSYSGIGEITDSIRPLLAKYQLCLAQSTEKIEGDWCLVTKLLSESGEWLMGYYPILTKDDSPQSWGSGLTYARRYTIQAMLMQGSSEFDDDGSNFFEPPVQTKQANEALTVRGPNDGNNASKPCTDNQVYKIGLLTDSLGWDKAIAQEWLQKTTGKSTRKELTKNQASEVIDLMMKLLDAVGMKESEDFGNNIDI